MIDIEERVREAFARTAAPVVPAPNPMGRLLIRHRRRGLRRLMTIAVTVFVALGSGGVLVAGGAGRPQPDTLDGYIVGDEIRSEWTRRLIASPTRGNLAADSALVAEVTAAFRDGWYGRSANVSPELGRIDILLLHQFDQQREAVAVFHNDTHAVLVSVLAPTDATPDALVNASSSSSTSGAEPFVILDQAPAAGVLALAPAGCEIAVSASADVDPAGVPGRQWEPVGDWIVRLGGSTQDWWQVTCAGQVHYRQPVSGYPQVEPDPAATDRPLRGTADPGMVRRAVAAWRSSGNGLGSPPAVVWGGVPAGQAQPVVVVAGGAPGGGSAVLALTGDGSFPNFADGPASRLIQGPPDNEVDTSITTGTGRSTGLLAVRLPDPRGAVSDRLLVIAPPDADAIRLAGADPVPLIDGVAVITRPRPLDTQVEAIRSGAVVDTMRLVEPTATGVLRFGIELIHRW
jgi:hypothetical protein